MDPDQIRENRRAWEAIADSFDSTRNKPWRAVEEFVEGLTPESWVLDAGCGNGRHAKLALEAGHRVVGLDLSRRLLERARRRSRSAEWVEGIIERLPFRPGTFGGVLGLAVIHHVRGGKNRVEVLDELVRVLAPHGRLLVSAWTRDQPRFGPDNPPRPPAKPGNEPGDANVRWSHHGLNVDRFIHLYDWTEWIGEVGQAKAKVERTWPEAIMTGDQPDNFFAILRPK